VVIDDGWSNHNDSSSEFGDDRAECWDFFIFLDCDGVVVGELVESLRRFPLYGWVTYLGEVF
jgi:hypothetical protein